jgi:isopentenyldiphosphate isomerase
MGNAHVWCWRKNGENIDVLLQKRALTKKKSPGFYHISAAGHINIGESAITAALRETREEIGVAVDWSRLYLVQATRSFKNWRSLLHVYTYQLNGDEQFEFEDGEVEEVKWCALDKFQTMTENPTEHMLIDQGRAYFDPLIAAIKRQAE